MDSIREKRAFSYFVYLKKLTLNLKALSTHRQTIIFNQLFVHAFYAYDIFPFAYLSITHIVKSTVVIWYPCFRPTSGTCAI